MKVENFGSIYFQKLIQDQQTMKMQSDGKCCIYFWSRINPQVIKILNDSNPWIHF